MLGAFLVVAQDLVSKESVGTPINEFVFGAVSSTPFSFFHVFLAMQHTCPGAVHWWFGKFLLCCVCCKCMSRARLAWKVIRKASNRRIENPEGCLCVWSRFFLSTAKHSCVVRKSAYVYLVEVGVDESIFCWKDHIMMIVATKVGARLFVMWFLVLYEYGLLYSHLLLMFDNLLLLFIFEYNLLSWFLFNLNVFYLIIVDLGLIAFSWIYLRDLGWGCLPSFILLFFSYFVYGGCIFDAGWCLVFSPSCHFVFPGQFGFSNSMGISLVCLVLRRAAKFRFSIL